MSVQVTFTVSIDGIQKSNNKGGLNMFAMDYIYFPPCLNLYLAEAKCLTVIFSVYCLFFRPNVRLIGSDIVLTLQVNGRWDVASCHCQENYCKPYGLGLI